MGYVIPNGYDKLKLSTQRTQVGGDHYKARAIQPWDVMQAVMEPAEFEAFLRGNVIKYIMRYDKKNGYEDLKKARHYLETLLEVYNV